MALPSEEGRNLMRAGLTEAYLLRINRYAYENELIDRETYLKMNAKIKTQSMIDQIMDPPVA